MWDGSVHGDPHRSKSNRTSIVVFTKEMSMFDAHMPMSAWGTHVQTCTPQNDTCEHGQSSGYIKTIMETFGDSTEELYIYVDKNKYTI